MTVPRLHPGRCYVCIKETDAPIIVTYNIDYKEKVKICSDRCLEKYNRMESNYKQRLEEKKLKELKPSEKMKKVQESLPALSTKKFNQDLKLEDIEDFSLDKA